MVLQSPGQGHSYGRSSVNRLGRCKTAAAPRAPAPRLAADVHVAAPSRRGGRPVRRRPSRSPSPASAQRCRWSPGRPACRRASTARPFAGDALALQLQADADAAARLVLAAAASASRPMKSPLSSFTAQPRPAWSGSISSLSSWPYSGMAASRRSVSRAPRPHGLAPAPSNSSHSVDRLRGGHHELQAVLAGVAGAADDAGSAVVPRRRGDSSRQGRRGRSRTGRGHSSTAFGPCTAIMQVVARLVDERPRRGRLGVPASRRSWRGWRR